MTFDKLEETISKEYTGFKNEVGKIKDRIVRNTLLYLLDSAQNFSNIGLNDQYALFGGYGVLAHILDYSGESLISQWRGSSDIDLAGTERIINAFYQFYNVTNNRPSPNLSDKNTIKIIKGDNPECKIDFVYLKNDFRTEQKKIYGIPITVADITYLIKSKLKIDGNEKDKWKHEQDVMNLIGVLYHSDKSVKSFVEEFGLDQRTRLHRIMINPNGWKSKEGVIALPSDGYVKDLKKALKKRGV